MVVYYIPLHGFWKKGKELLPLWQAEEYEEGKLLGTLSIFCLIERTGDGMRKAVKSSNEAGERIEIQGSISNNRFDAMWLPETYFKHAGRIRPCRDEEEARIEPTGNWIPVEIIKKAWCYNPDKACREITRRYPGIKARVVIEPSVQTESSKILSFAGAIMGAILGKG